MSTTYIDPYAYLRAAPGLDTATVVANLTRLASPIMALATSITLSAPLASQLNVYDQVYIFDGSQSEIVTVTAQANALSSTITVSATQYAHAAGIPLCSDGIKGSLASMIINASADLEAYCRQPLLAASYSNEMLPLRSMRAAVTRDYTLMLRPKRFPVTAISSATLVLTETTVTLDVNQAKIDADAQTIQFLDMSSTGGASGTPFWGIFSPPARQTTPGYVQITYNAGYAYGALPSDIKQAAIWLTSDLLADRRNPTGAAEVGLGKSHVVTRLRGDTSGLSLLALRAYHNLDPYRQRAF
jgi:hypothetical protein